LKWIVLLITVLLACLVSAPAAIGADSVYWTNYGAKKISFANLDGSDATDLAVQGTTVAGPEGLALDPAGGRIYWTDGTVPKISFANLDGSGGGNLFTGNATMSLPIGLALDHAAGRIYWANYTGNKISFANLDGSGGGDLFTGGATVSLPVAVALDRAAGRIYWANRAGNKISYANLDGSGGGDLFTGGATMNNPDGLALDLAAGRIYWANESTNKISYANLDGSGGGDLFTGLATVNLVKGLALDPAAGRIYWANNGTDKISYANLDGSGGGDLITLPSGSPTGAPNFLALLRAPSPAEVPSLSGSARLGAPLTCSSGAWAPDLPGSSLYQAPQSFSYGWLRDGQEVNAATATSFTPTAPGSYQCLVTAANHAGSSSQTSSAVLIQDDLSTQNALSAVSLRLGKLKRNPKNGTATLQAVVSGAGRVALDGKKVRAFTRSAGGAGSVTLVIRSKEELARAFHRGLRRAKVSVTVTFTPNLGVAVSQTRKLSLAHATPTGIGPR
jgi:low density lipoprotein receptor-related protein 5/6